MSVYDIGPEELLQLAREDHHLMLRLQDGDPEMYNAVISGNVSSIRLVLMKRHLTNHKFMYERKQEMARIEVDFIVPILFFVNFKHVG